MGTTSCGNQRTRMGTAIFIITRQALDTLAKQVTMDLRHITTAAKGLLVLNPQNSPYLDGTHAVAVYLMQLLTGTLDEDTFVLEGFETVEAKVIANTH